MRETTILSFEGDWPWDVMDSMVSNGTEGAIVNTESTFKVNGDRVYRRYGFVKHSQFPANFF